MLLPSHWADIPWDDFPMTVQVDGIWYTPEHTLDKHFRRLSQATKEALIEGFNWDHWLDVAYYYGKTIMFGKWYGYPKCCIHAFTFKDNTAFNYNQQDLALRFSSIYDAWIPCHGCQIKMKELSFRGYLELLPNWNVYQNRYAPLAPYWKKIIYGKA